MRVPALREIHEFAWEMAADAQWQTLRWLRLWGITFGRK